MIEGALASAQSVGPIPPGYRAVAEAHGIPSALFYAIALAESGRRVPEIGARRPWPWTLNVAGKGRYFPNRVAATQALAEELAGGERSVDIGLMQVNWRHHATALGSIDRALDPYHNLRIAAAILAACEAVRGDWWQAVGCYHAPNDPPRAARYTARVRRIWVELAPEAGEPS